jgi:hypothetical protein
MSDDSKSTTLKQEVMDKIAALVTAAFGLVAALAWNDAIKAVFKEVFGTADAVGPMCYNHCSHTNNRSSSCSS